MITYVIFWTLSLFTSFLVRNRFQLWLFLAGVFLFVGLRYETGTDWPVYKEIFSDLQGGISPEKITLLQYNYNQEAGFIFILGLMAQLFSNFEAPQAIFTAFFIYSFVKLSSVIVNARVSVALALYLSFFLLPVGFSTVRQTLAISLFNFGLYLFLQGGSKRAYLLFISALAVHVSSIFYIFAFFIAKTSSIGGRFWSYIYIIGIFVLLYVFSPYIEGVISSVSTSVSYKIEFYNERDVAGGFTVISAALSLLSMFILLFVSLFSIDAKGGEEIVKLYRKIIIILSAMVIFSSYFPTIMYRISYELIILFCIYISITGVSHRFIASTLIVVSGIFYQAVLILKYPVEMAYIPYQNSATMFLVGDKSTGSERNKDYMARYHEMSK